MGRADEFRRSGIPPVHPLPGVAESLQEQPENYANYFADDAGREALLTAFDRVLEATAPHCHVDRQANLPNIRFLSRKSLCKISRH